MMCNIFYPKDCEGCDAQSECVDSPLPPTTTTTVTPSYNKGKSIKNGGLYLIVCVLFYVNLF